MTQRKCKKIYTGINIIQFEEAMVLYANAEARRSDILTQLELEMNRVKDKYKHELLYLNEKKRTALEIVETYCREQKENLFKKRRTMHTMHGSVGFRLGQPKLRIKPGYCWSRVIHKLKENMPEYIRISEEPAKDLLVADRNKESVANLLAKSGVEVVQDELFFIEIRSINVLK
jgi:phage host-nuclease inhibitor protein Gam